jgi:hypothetical protein
MNEQALEAYEKQIREAQLNTESARVGQAQQDLMMQEQGQGMISEQLDLSELLDSIHNLLKGYILTRVDGKSQWIKPENNDLIILSDYGINFVMDFIQWYLNKNTLLSNYSEEQINAKMEDLSMTLIDTIFMESDKMFLYPTLEDCKAEIEERIERRKETKKFALSIMGKEQNDAEIEREVLKDMEFRIEKEMEVIKQQKIKNKLKRFGAITRVIQDAIHSTYQRAWKGQERSTLRQHTHISETKGGFHMPQQSSNINPFGIFKGR